MSNKRTLKIITIKNKFTEKEKEIRAEVNLNAITRIEEIVSLYNSLEDSKKRGL